MLGYTKKWEVPGEQRDLDIQIQKPMRLAEWMEEVIKRPYVILVFVKTGHRIEKHSNYNYVKYWYGQNRVLWVEVFQLQGKTRWAVFTFLGKRRLRSPD